MHGAPKTLQTKEDYEVCHAEVLAGYPAKNEMIDRWQSLIDTQQIYVFDRILAADEAADGAEPDYRVVEDKLEDGTIERHQFILVADSASMLGGLGYTVAEVQAKMTELEAL